ncbi:MAG: pullulanase [Fidelibacterota bacterium]
MSHSLPYGAHVIDNQTTFRLYAPTADAVFLVIFDRPEAETGEEFSMEHQSNGDWTLTVADAGFGTLYGYRLEGLYQDDRVIIADPWTQAAVTQNTYRHVAKSLIVDTSYDWERDHWQKIDPRDLVIYEMHIRDMTADPSARCSRPGTYHGLIEPDQEGGLSHLKAMGINAVQILPAQDFANVEVPYRDASAPVYNTWNPYARNHWGYMTTFFFAPETYYASDGTMEPGAWNGRDGRAVREFKDMVKALHREKIAVIMDVVYNHVSNYDWQPFKYIERSTYFRLDENGQYNSQSGCGNDTRTEDPAMRQVILESVKYWMTEYHVDGFRFDLGNLIDPETRAMIIAELRSINPNIIILAEPWGGGYDPAGFSDQGWASFNDQFRNGVKGQNPRDGKGFIFGEWQGNNDQRALQRFMMGSLRSFGGQYVDVRHSVNYLESHDDYTFGDFIRLGAGNVAPEQVITDRMANAMIRDRHLDLNKLGALYLFTSQGIVFIHEGQEWGRSKVIAPTNVPDDQVGQLDHNSYNKDNETNWLNWQEREMNRELVNYYRGLIALRLKESAFRRSQPEQFQFLAVGNRTALAYVLQDEFLVVLNGEPEQSLTLELPPGDWSVIVDKTVHDEQPTMASSPLAVPPTSGMILRRR